MADCRQTKKNSKESIVNKAIPKVVTALQAIISRTKDEEFRERCLQKLLIKETTNLACALESKLWGIAEQRLDVKQILNESEKDEQVVPGEETSAQTSLAKNNSHQISSLEKDPFDDLALIDMTYPLTDANTESFYENENENNTHNISARKPTFLPALNSLSSKEHTQDRLDGKVPSLNSTGNSLLEYKDEKTDSQASKDDWLNNFTEDSFWMDNNQDCSLLVGSQNFLKRQRSPVSSTTRKIVATRSEPNLHACNFIHSKEQGRVGTEVVIISDEEEEHNEVDERTLETKSHYQRHSISSQTKLDDSEIRLDGKSDNAEDPSHQNVSEHLTFPSSQHLVDRHKSNNVHIIEPYGIKDEIIFIGEVPDVHEADTITPIATQSSQLQITKITDRTLIHDFDALEDNFDN